MNRDDDIYGLEGEDSEPYQSAQQSDAVARRYWDPNAPSLRCVRCRYELRGLTIGSACPECGLTIGQGDAGIGAPMSGYATASLVMGILSLVSCMFYGIPALVLGPLAIWFAAKAKAQVMQGAASTSSLGLASAGKITGIIGLSLAGAIAVLFVVLIVFVGYGMSGFP